MADKKAYHPDGLHEIYFQEKNHIYIDNLDNKYISCTSIFKPFFLFDSVAVSEKCAVSDNIKYAGRNPEEIRKEWLEEGLRGSSEGTNIHEYAEWKISQERSGKVTTPVSKSCELKFKQVGKIINYLMTKYEFLKAEMIVFSPILKVAGQIDLLMYDEKTNTILIIDWKTNKQISTENFFQNIKKPFEYLQQTALNQYTLQLSLYEFLLKKERYFPRVKNYKRILIHITEKRATPIHLEFFEYEINQILNGIKKHDKK